MCNYEKLLRKEKKSKFLDLSLLAHAYDGRGIREAL